MNRRKFLAGLTVAGSVALLAQPARADTLTFKLGTNDTPESPTGISVRVFAREVDRLSGGTMKIAIFEASVLGTNPTQIQNVIAGAQDMHLLYPFFLGNFIDQAKLVSAPYLFRNIGHLQSFYKGDLFKPALEKLRATGAEILDLEWTWLMQDPQGFLSKKPVFAPDDIAGMKVRTTDDSTAQEMWRGLGASPVVVPRAQVYIALTQGVVTAAPESIGVAYDLKDIEVAKYWTLTETNSNILNVLMNGARFRALTESERQILRQAMQTAGASFAAETLRAFNEKMAKSREQFGVTIIEPNPAPWRDKGKQVLLALEAKGFIPKGTVQSIQTP